MIIGLNNGGFYRLNYDRLSQQVINKIIKTRVNAIEFTCLKIEMLDSLMNFELPSNEFKFISLHTPEFEYRDDLITRDIFNKILQITERLNINNIIVHSDNIKELDVFNSFKHLPLSVENSDSRKEFGRSVNDIKTILNNSNFNLTLDIQHCYVNDNTLKLADDFYKEFSNKIVEYHISGYDEKIDHYTLYKTKQDIIIDFLKNKTQPIILESVYDNLNEVEFEIEYIKNRLLI